MRTLTILLALCLAWPASAGWVGCPGSVSNTSTMIPLLSPGTDLCFAYDVVTTDPPRVRAHLCRDVKILVDADLDTEATATDAAVHAFECLSDDGAGQADCEKILVDRDGDGVADDTAMTGAPGLNNIYHAPPTILSFDLGASGNPADTAVIKLTCTRP